MALAGPPRNHENGAAAKAIFTPVRRISIPRTSVNRGEKKEGPECTIPGPRLQYLRRVSSHHYLGTYSFSGRTTITGQWACSMTLLETLPMSALRIPPWPLLPITTKPAPNSSANKTILSSALPTFR